MDILQINGKRVLSFKQFYYRDQEHQQKKKKEKKSL